MTIDLAQRTKVFISYSHQDSEWLQRLRVHLRPLERDHKVEVWDDTKIKSGSVWRKEIEEALAAAKVAILLISADFLASDFIAKDELPPLLKAAEERGATILPLILSPSRFDRSPSLARFQAVNAPSKPLISLTRSEQEAVLVKVTVSVEVALGHTTEDAGNEALSLKIGESDTRKSLKQLIAQIHPTIWVAMISGLVALTVAYWQSVYKPGPGPPGPESNYTGRITDSRTDRPIHKAKVSIEEDQKVPQIQVTDSEGIFHVVLRGPTVAARIRVEADGYESFDRNVTFSRTGVEPIILTPRAPTPTPTTVPAATATPIRRPTQRPKQPLAPKPRICSPEDIARGKC